VKKSTKKQLVWFVAGAFIVGIVVFLYPRLRRPDARVELAKVLGVNPEFLHLNIPPSTGRLPGSTFVISGSLLPIDFTSRDDKDLISGDPFALDWHITTLFSGEGASGAGPLGVLFENSEAVRIEIRAHDCRVIEMKLPVIKDRLLHSKEVLEQSARGNNPFVVVRAFEGTLETRLTKSGKESARAWDDVKESARRSSKASQTNTTRISLAGTSEDEVIVSWPTPVVFAYEVQKASLITTHLGTKPDDVNFAPVSVSDLTNATPKNPKPTAKSEGTGGWAMLTIASGYYPQVQFLNQEWNASSAGVFEDALLPYHPSSVLRLRSSADTSLTANLVLSNATQFVKHATEEGRSLVVVYYVGHTVSGASGNLWLVQSDATVDSIQDAGKTPPNLKPVGENLDQLSKIADAVQATYGDGPKGMLAVEKLCAALSEGGVRFALIIDGCMEDQAFKDMANAVGFQFNPRYPELFYVGKSDVVTTEMSDFANLLDHFGQSMPCLRSENPVILAAKPGTVALGVKNPFVEGGPPLGPLAVRAKEVVTAGLLNGESPPLATVIKSLASYRGVGEINLKGSISWSDFDGFEKSGRALRPETENNASAGAQGAAKQFKVLRPEVGDIRDFVYLPSQKRFLILANFFDLWSWSPDSGPAKKLKGEGEMHVPTIGGTQRGDSYLFDAGTHDIRALNSEMTLVATNLDLGLLTPGADGSSLVVVCNESTIGQADPVLRVRANTPTEIDKFETVNVNDFVEWSPGKFAFTKEDDSEILLRENGKESVLCDGLSSPNLLLADGNVLYCLSATSETLYLITREASVEKAPLLNIGGDVPLERAPVVRGFRLESPGVLLLAAGSNIVEIAVNSLSWSKNKATVASQ
jgi:hypothetical protein